MTRERWVIVIVAAVAVAAALLYFSGRKPEQVHLDLLRQFDTASKRPAEPPPGEVFELAEVTINGVTKRAIRTPATSRMTWKVTVPVDASLRTWLALQPEVWDKPGDGVLFRIGVSDGNSYEELLNQHVNPQSARGDRQWVPVSVDLAAFGGRSVEIIFNTNASLPGRGNDTTNDKPLWGEPAIYVRQ